MPLVRALWRHRWLAFGTAWLVCTAGWIGATFLPTKFESSARVYLNTDPLLTTLLHGLAADTNPGRHLDFMLHTLLSRPNLEQLIRLTDLNTGIWTPGEKEALLKGLASDISVVPITANLLTLSYRNTDLVLAKNVVQSLLTIFVEKMAGSNRADMDSAQRLLDDEIASCGRWTVLTRIEERLLELRRNLDGLLLKYTEEHPDVKAARQAIAQLQAEATSWRQSLRWFFSSSVSALEKCTTTLPLL